MSLSTEQFPSSAKCLTESQICDALSALSVLSRQIFKEELERALLDTSMDYHRETDREAQLLLATEIHSLDQFIKLIVHVDKEFSDG